jgi:hypothetical protein
MKYRIRSSLTLLAATAALILLAATAAASFEARPNRKSSGRISPTHGDRKTDQTAGQQCPAKIVPVDIAPQVLAPTLARLQEEFQKIYAARNCPGMSRRKIRALASSRCRFDSNRLFSFSPICPLLIILICISNLFFNFLFLKSCVRASIT